MKEVLDRKPLRTFDCWRRISAEAKDIFFHPLSRLSLLSYFLSKVNFDERLVGDVLLVGENL
jgi:hypothetical protein